MTTSTTTPDTYGLDAAWYTPNTLAPLVGMSAATVRAAVRAGHLQPHRATSPKARIRIARADALAWLAAMRTAPAEPEAPAPAPAKTERAKPGSRRKRPGIDVDDAGRKRYR